MDKKYYISEIKWWRRHQGQWLSRYRRDVRRNSESAEMSLEGIRRCAGWIHKLTLELKEVNG